MRMGTIALLSILAAANAWTAAPAASQDRRFDARQVVDLNEPGAMAALALARPDHYVKVERILAEVARRPAESVPRWMNAQFGAQAVSFPSLLKTSDPAKRSLAFTLDTTRYEVLVQVPARWSFAAR